MRKIILLSSLLLTLLAGAFFVQQVYAQPTDTKYIGNPLAKDFGSDAKPSSAGDIEGFFSERFGDLLDIMFALLGAISIFPVVIGGLQLIISRGNADMATKGKNTLTWGVLGLLIAFSGIIFFNFLLGALIVK